MKRNTVILLLLVIASDLLAQKKKSEGEPSVQSSSIAAKVSGMTEYIGYFNFYYDGKQDKIHLLIDKLNTEFI